MDAYTGFAEVYDTFMDNIPYGEWCRYLTGLLKKYGVEDGLVLDLGCGTGSVTELLAEEGYDMIGVDNSEDMLQIAMDKRAASGRDILYLLQDMRDFELYGTVAAVVSICDCMNYILETMIWDGKKLANWTLESILVSSIIVLLLHMTTITR